MKSKFYIITIICVFFVGCSSIVKTVIPLNSLPEPKGDYNVGTSLFHWIDESRLEWFSEEDSTDFRELMVQIWYPSDEIPTTSSNPYMHNLEQRIPEFSKQVGLPSFLINHITEIKTQSYLNLKIAKNNSKYPLIIFSHGLGGMRVQNTAYIQELVSHGFIIMAMNHTYDANITIFPNNDIRYYKSNLPKNIKTEYEALQLRYKQLKTRTDDVIFALDELEKLSKKSLNKLYNKINFENVGIFGHSFGGATSISASFHDSRITASLSLDGWFEILTPEILNTGLTNPFFHLGQEKWKEKLNYQNRDILINNSSGNNWVGTFLNSKHFDYMDLPLFTNRTQTFNLTGKIAPMEFYKCLNEIQLSFFNYYLKNSGEFNPNKIAEKYLFMIIEEKKFTKDFSEIE